MRKLINKFKSVNLLKIEFLILSIVLVISSIASLSFIAKVQKVVFLLSYDEKYKILFEEFNRFVTFHFYLGIFIVFLILLLFISISYEFFKTHKTYLRYEVFKKTIIEAYNKNIKKRL